MNRTEYRQARRLIRDNGKSALNWMPAQHKRVMAHLELHRERIDYLAERADMLNYASTLGVRCTPKQTGRLPQR